MKRSMGWVGNLNGEYKSMNERELSLQTVHLVLLFLVRSQVMDATLSISSKPQKPRLLRRAIFLICQGMLD